jgi:TolA-binding protein
MAEIRKLKKQLLKEERKRLRNSSSAQRRWRRLVIGLLLLAPLVVSVYLGNQDKIFTYRFEQASRLLEAKQYQAAVAAFQSLGQDHPEQAGAPRALFLAAETQQLYLRQSQEALLAYLLLARDYPVSPEALEAQLRAAELYKNELRDYNQALALLQKVADSGPPQPDQVQYEIADTYFRLNNFEQARIEFESLAANYPDSLLLPEVQYRIGMALVFEKRLPEAARALKRVAEAWPGHRYAIEAKFHLAGVLEEQEYLQRALEILKELQGIYPQGEILQQRMRQVEERIQKKKKAI